MTNQPVQEQVWHRLEVWITELVRSPGVYRTACRHRCAPPGRKPAPLRWFRLPDYPSGPVRQFAHGSPATRRQGGVIDVETLRRGRTRGFPAPARHRSFPLLNYPELCGGGEGRVWDCLTESNRQPRGSTGTQKPASASSSSSCFHPEFLHVVFNGMVDLH